MRSMILSTMVCGAALLGSLPAGAAEMQTVLDAGDTAATPLLVLDGCGPGFHRGYYGRCRPNFYRGGYGYGYGRGYGYYHRGWARHWGF